MRNRRVVDLGVSDLDERLQTDPLTSQAPLDRYLARIESYDQAYGSEPGVNAVIAPNPDAIAHDRALDAERPAGKIRGRSPACRSS